jgi:RNA polymerase sigma-70 factor (ECF subfamily)
MHATAALRSIPRAHLAEDTAVALPSAAREVPAASAATPLPAAAPSNPVAEQLIRDWQAGVQTAATGFYYLYKDRVYRWARVKTRDVHLAEDLCQEVWRRIHRSLRTYRFGTSPNAWVYRIVINTHRSLWLRGQRFFARLLPAPGEEPADGGEPAAGSAFGGTPEALYTRKQEMEHILHAMHELPESFRRVVFLRYVEGLPIEEVAQILGISDGTVKSRLNRGIDKLREKMGLRGASRQGGVR